MRHIIERIYAVWPIALLITIGLFMVAFGLLRLLS